MAAGLRLATRNVESPPAEASLSRSVTEGGVPTWREMMALLPQVEPAQRSPEQQTCTECDRGTETAILPPETFLG